MKNPILRLQSRIAFQSMKSLRTKLSRANGGRRIVVVGSLIFSKAVCKWLELRSKDFYPSEKLSNFPQLSTGLWSLSG